MGDANDAAKRGFTLVEILIVVVILGILACIVIPQVADASEESRVSALLTDLQTIRMQIQLYKAQHRDTYPDQRFINQMTRYTNIDGVPRLRPNSTYRLGPYLQGFPKNPISGDARVRVVQDAQEEFTARPRNDRGWYYNTQTGEFRADLTDQWVDADGVPLNQK